jgi:hypothetical protein
LTKSKVKDVSRSRGKKPDTEDEEEDDSVDTSGSENIEASESEHSMADISDATLEEEDADGSESESEGDAALEEVEAEGSESELEEDVEILEEESNETFHGCEEARAMAVDDVTEESEDSDFYYNAENNEEDKKEIKCVTLPDAKVLEFEEQFKTSKKKYARFFKELAIPKLSKHLPLQQSMDLVQYLGKKVDLMDKIKPTVEEIRSFMYLQELVFLFAKKEKKILEESVSEYEEDEVGDKSPIKQCSRKQKSKKNTQAACKYLFLYFNASFVFFS